MIKSKVVWKNFPGATSKEFVHYIKPTLQENEFDSSVSHMGIIDVLKLGSTIVTVSRYHKYCQILEKCWCETNHYFRFDTYYAVNNSIKILCEKHGDSFIDNSNVSSENLLQDGLNLNN